MIMAAIYNYKTLDFAVKDVDAASRRVKGYFSAFDKTDSYGDVVRKGAYAKTIQEQGPNAKRPRIKHLMNHDVNKPLGKLNTLTEDDYGLLYESTIGTHALGDDFLKMADSGLITEHSIGYTVVKQNQLKDWKDAKEGEAIWELVELKLYEGSSLTGWGVNQFTPLLPKSVEDANKVAQRMKALEAFCRNSDATDETIELLLIEAKQLSQLLIDLTAKDVTVPVPATQPIATDWAKVAMAIQLL
jgi:HK97 family phage prohead protease